MARILSLMPDLPYPPQQGAAMRNWGILRALTGAGHELHLLCAGGGPIEPALREHCAEIRCVPVRPRAPVRRLSDWLMSEHADLAYRLRHADLERALRGMLRRYRYDAVQMEGLEMSAHLNLLRESGLRLIYDAHNAEAALQDRVAALSANPLLRAYSRAQARRLARYEAALCAAVAAVLAVSEEDATSLRALAPSAKVRVIPNAIDVADFAGERGESATPTLVFSGKMDYRPNVDALRWFLKDIWPKIRQEETRARLKIMGRSPTKALRRRDGREGVEVTGAVAEMRSHLLRATLYIAPLRMGGGTRLKLLEAMAAGCAILATPVAAAGLPDAQDVLVLAEDEGGFASKACALLKDPDWRAQLGEAARAHVRQRYDWSRVAPLVRAVYEEEGNTAGMAAGVTKSVRSFE